MRLTHSKIWRTKIEPARVRPATGHWIGEQLAGSHWGAFVFGPLRVISSTGEGWDHVSVSLQDRCPTWEEMCAVKDLFFEEEEPVMQLHPPQSQWMNCHPFCLHLWRPQHVPIPLPPQVLV